MKFYEVLRVGYGILEDALYEIRRRFSGGEVVVFTGDELSLPYGERVAEAVGGVLVPGDRSPEYGGYALVLGVGGGSVIDRAKLWAYERGIPFVSVPTLASSDGIASPVSVLNGESRFLALPYGVVVDLGIIAEAPKWSVRAGIGDLVSNLSASLDWDRFRDKSQEPYSPEASAMARLGAVSLLSTRSPDSLEALVWGLILSGLAMNVAGSSRPASGPEHKVSHALDSLGYGEKHGIQVGIFTPLFLKLNGYPLWEEVREYLTEAGLPRYVTLTEEEAIEVFSRASETRPHRYTVLEDMGWERVLEEAVGLGFVRIREDRGSERRPS